MSVDFLFSDVMSECSKKQMIIACLSKDVDWKKWAFPILWHTLFNVLTAHFKSLWLLTVNGLQNVCTSTSSFPVEELFCPSWRNRTIIILSQYVTVSLKEYYLDTFSNFSLFLAPELWFKDNFHFCLFDKQKISRVPVSAGVGIF